MNDYDKNIESSYLMFWDGNNLYGWEMSQKILINSFKLVKKLSKFNERLTKNYNENSDRGYFLEVGVSIRKPYLVLMRIYHFYQKEKIGKVEKLICSIEDKEKYVIHIRALKQALNHGLKLQKVQRVIQFNQRACLKSCINMNTKLRKEAKNEFEKGFL